MAQGITVDMTANLVKFEGQIDKGLELLDKFQSKAERIGTKIDRSLSAIGVGLSVGGLAAFVKTGLDAVDALNDLSDRTGIAVEKLAGFDYAAKLGDTSVEAMATSLNKLSVNIGKNGDDFKKIGIDAKDPLDAFAQLADQYVAIQDQQTRAAFGAAALGKAYAEMAPLLMRGGDGFRALIKDGQEMSRVTAEQAKQAGDFNDTLDELAARSVGFRSKAAVSILEPLVSIGDALEKDIAKFGLLEGALRGVSDGYKNFALSGTGSGLSQGLDDINRKIAEQKIKLSELRRGELQGGAAREIAENDTLNRLLAERVGIEEKLSASRRQQSVDPAAKAFDEALARQFIAKFQDESHAAKSAESAAKQAAKAEKTRSKSVAETIAALELDIAISKLSADQQRQAIELSNVLKNAKGGEVDILTNLVEAKYANIAVDKRQQEQWDQMIDDANAYYDLRKAIGEFERSNSIGTDGLNNLIGQTQDLLKFGAIDEKQAKAAYDQLGKAYNDGFIDPALSGTDQLSQFAVQAAHNIESSFASFIRNTGNGFDDLEASFADTLATMASNWAASRLGDLLLGKNFGTDKASGDGLIQAGAAIVGSLFHDGGLVGAGGRAIDVPASAFAGAPRLHGGGYLQPGEVPAILQTGEMVLSRRQVAAMSSGGGGGDVQISTVVNVTGNGSADNAQALGGLINSRVREVIATEKRPGGLLA
ncbi:hypothetical protein [Methylomonas sp. CM2]|uniref:hypothetical protein n=1 Tax=Methylomonas sp. CM2 TaxID=3417647 RepID=UPI003CED29E5